MFSGTFLDVYDFPGIVKSSNLLLRHFNTSVDVVEGLEEAAWGKSRNKSLPGSPETMILAQNRDFWHVLDVNHFQGIVKSSNMFLRHTNTSVDVVEGLEGALQNKSRNKSLPGRPGNHDFGSRSCFLAHFWT